MHLGVYWVSSINLLAETKTPYRLWRSGWKLVLMWPTASMTACAPCGVANFLPSLPVVNIECDAALRTNDYDHAT